MTSFLVSGLINIETTLKISGFPLEYNPVNYPFFGIKSTVSGVGYNIAKALTTLDNKLCFVSLIGHDFRGQLMLEALRHDHIPTEYVVAQSAETPQSIILYDDTGRRQIHVDLKDMQDQVYPVHRFEHAMHRSDWLILCNINFSRPFLAKARQAGKPVVTDVHAIEDINDEYNRDFMQAADVLFLSDVKLPVAADEFAREVMRCYKPAVLVVCMGDKGALLCQRDQEKFTQVPAVHTRKVVSTVGAGDALLSAFVHFYAHGADPHTALRQAAVFASYKIGFASASDGFLDQQDLRALYREVQGQLESAA